MEDEMIVRLFHERNEKALSELSRKYGGYFLRVAERILYDREDAKDCVNDAYLKTWESIPPARPNVLKAFVGKIVKCAAVSMLRAGTAQKRGGGMFDLVIDELGDCVSGSATVESEFESKQIVAEINKFLRGCTEFNRRAFILRYWHCESVSDIAAKLGASENKISVALYRTRQKLKEHLEKEGYTL
ncbi:MAG: sigma-70 family RNA polymerase sigma factor [Ruminococcus sp.]|nr:sigma-70 family RNA polymerase sigma factor [Ruminococcus sp.]